MLSTGILFWTQQDVNIPEVQAEGNLYIKIKALSFGRHSDDGVTKCTYNTVQSVYTQKEVSLNPVGLTLLSVC